MRRTTAIVLLAVGLALVGLDLRPVTGAGGVVRMTWSFFGAGSSVSMVEFAEGARSWLPWTIGAALVLSAFLGAWSAKAIAARLGRSAGFGSKALCSLAWAAALDPQVLLFVATRQASSADRYLDVGDLFRALGLGAACVGLGLLVLPRRQETEAPREESLASLAAAIAVAILLPEAISWFCLGHHPLSNDEFAYLFQAQNFARGELARDVGALADFFPSVQTQIAGGRTFAIVFPGHSAMLVPGVWLGFPLLLQRLLAGASVLLAWLLGRRLGIARPLWGAWALALCPAFLAVETLNLAHGTSLPLLLLFVWATLEAVDRPRSPRFALLAGLAFSIAFAARPVTALAFGVPILALFLRERPRGTAKVLLAMLAAAVPAAIGFLEFDRRLTGSPFQSVYGAFMTTDVSVYGKVDPANAASITAFNLSRTSIWLLGLAPGLLLPAVALGFALRHARTWILAALPASLLAFYALHPFQGIPWVGPVYLSDALPCLALLAAEGLCVLESALGRAAVRVAWTSIACGSLVLLANHFLLAREEIGLRQRPYEAARRAGIERGVVFLRLESVRAWRLYPLAPPEPGSALVFARDLGARNGELVRALGDLPAWTWDPSTGDLARIE